jgi:Domain of unknown function (DUF4388)
VSLQGSFETIALADVMALLASSNKSGELRVVGNHVEGRLWLRDGQLVGSKVGKAHGHLDALFELLRLTEGNFVFKDGVDAPGPEEATPVGPVVRQAEERLKEWRDIEVVVPSLEHRVRLIPDLPVAEVTLSAEEWRLVIATALAGTVHGVLEELGLGLFDGCRGLRRLVEAGLVIVDPPRVRPSASDPGRVGRRAFAANGSAVADDVELSPRQDESLESLAALAAAASSAASESVLVAGRSSGSVPMGSGLDASRSMGLGSGSGSDSGFGSVASGSNGLVSMGATAVGYGSIESNGGVVGSGSVGSGSMGSGSMGSEERSMGPTPMGSGSMGSAMGSGERSMGSGDESFGYVGTGATSVSSGQIGVGSGPVGSGPGGLGLLSGSTGAGFIGSTGSGTMGSAPTARGPVGSMGSGAAASWPVDSEDEDYEESVSDEPASSASPSEYGTISLLRPLPSPEEYAEDDREGEPQSSSSERFRGRLVRREDAGADSPTVAEPPERDSEGDGINRGLLLKFLSSVRS